MDSPIEMLYQTADGIDWQGIQLDNDSTKEALICLPFCLTLFFFYLSSFLFVS